MKAATFDFENHLWMSGLEHIIGIDEVGRGSFAGPLVAAGVIFPRKIKLNYDIFDSKLLSAQQRQVLVPKIKENALAYTVTQVDVNIINKVGILRATHIAFRKILKTINYSFEHILIDGFTITHIPKRTQTALIQGDRLSNSIGAASILAKEYRDDLMRKLNLSYPKYNFKQNKGYGTKEHRDAIAKFGLSSLHRASFNLDKYVQ